MIFYITTCLFVIAITILTGSRVKDYIDDCNQRITSVSMRSAEAEKKFQDDIDRIMGIIEGKA